MSDLNFQVRQVYNFKVYPAALLGNDFNGVTILAIMDRDSAAKEIDPQGKHIQVYPFLPAGTPNDPNAYDYIKIRTSAGIVTILGIAWIDPSSIVLVSQRTATIVVDNVNAGDVPRIVNALSQNGFRSVSVSLS
jgi:hypothetical protein